MPCEQEAILRETEDPELVALLLGDPGESDRWVKENEQNFVLLTARLSQIVAPQTLPEVTSK